MSGTTITQPKSFWARLLEPSSFAVYALAITTGAPYVEHALSLTSWPGIVLAIASGLAAILKAEGVS